MHYDEYGKRKNHTIVFLHGALATDTFCNQYCFQDKYHLVIPHLYGSGKEVEEIYEPEKTIRGLAEIIKGLGKEKVTLIGHSLGGELAVAMVSRYEYLFDKAVFLSPWVCATQKSIDKFVKMARYTSVFLKSSWLMRLQAKFWHYTKQQEDFMIEYSKKITSEQYQAVFKKRIFLDDQTNYSNINIPMLAVCGQKEVKEVIVSTEELGRRNLNCKTLILDNERHDFPQRNADLLNPILLDYIR